MRRRSIEPEKAETGTAQRRGENGQFPSFRKVYNVKIATEIDSARDVGNCRQGEGTDGQK